MRYLFQFMRIIIFCFLGEVVHAILPFPIPASIYGLVLLLVALKTGLVRLDQIREAGNFLTAIFPFLFVPAAAGVMELWGQMGTLAIPIVIAVLPFTAVVMVVGGRTTQAIVRRGKSKEETGVKDALELDEEV